MQGGWWCTVGTRAGGCDNGYSLGEDVGQSKRVVPEDAGCESERGCGRCLECCGLSEDWQRARGMQLRELGKELCPDGSCLRGGGWPGGQQRGRERAAARSDVSFQQEIALAACPRRCWRRAAASQTRASCAVKSDIMGAKTETAATVGTPWRRTSCRPLYHDATWQARAVTGTATIIAVQPTMQSAPARSSWRTCYRALSQHTERNAAPGNPRLTCGADQGPQAGRQPLRAHDELAAALAALLDCPPGHDGACAAAHAGLTASDLSSHSLPP
jgi:hypothetical protein